MWVWYVAWFVDTKGYFIININMNMKAKTKQKTIALLLY